MGERGFGINCVRMGRSGREVNLGNKATRCNTVRLFAIDQKCSGLLGLHQVSRRNLWQTSRPLTWFGVKWRQCEGTPDMWSVCNMHWQ